MKFYSRTQVDKASCINRCYFEADHGYIFDALRRIDDLDKEFPDDAQIYYAKGCLLIDYLGKGNEGREYFKKAYDLDSTNSLYLVNIMRLSSDWDEYRKWATIVLNSQNDENISIEGKKEVQSILNEFSNQNYFEFLIVMSKLYDEKNDYGLCVSTLEIALNNYEYSSEIEMVALRRIRAEYLRKIDKSSDAKRAKYGLTIPPKERLSLEEAFKELEKAIELDEYDPELWNLKSAWAILLGKHEDAMIYAKKAIEMRPHNYPKPYNNLAIAYSNLKMFDEAFEYAEKSKLEAESANSREDIKIAKDFIKKLPDKKKGLQLEYLEPLANLILIYVHKFAKKNIKQYNKFAGQNLEQENLSFYNSFSLSFNNLSSFILDRINKDSSSQDYIDVMAEMLSTFPPETVFMANLKLFDKGKIEINEKCLIAALYLAANSEGVQRSDAAKFILISILANFKADKIRELYRRLILAPSQAATNELSQLNTILIQEINRIGIIGSERLNELIVKQAPISHAEIENAQKEILNRFIYLDKTPKNIYLLFGGPGNSPSPSGLKLGSFIKRVVGNRKRL